jgi:hypothetical protein
MLRIGYVDEDGGQRNSFYHYLKDEFEIILPEITEDTTVEKLVQDILGSGLDVLVLDYMLSENGLVDFNAESLVDRIYEINRYYPLVILTSHETDALDQIANAHLINGKDILDNKLMIFKHKLNKISQDYKSEIQKSEKELLELENTRNSEAGLSAAQEDRYVELNSFLDSTIQHKGKVSRTFYSEETNSKLDNLIELTEQMIKKLPDQK